MDAQALTQAIYNHFERVGYPILGVTLHTDDALLPWVELWDDDSEISRAIVCYVQPEQRDDAAAQARGLIAAWDAAGEAACGAVAIIASPDGFEEVGEV